MSKQKNQDLILKTLKKMYKGTSVEGLVNNAEFLTEINKDAIQNSEIDYPLTDNLVKFYLRETIKEEKISKFYYLVNFSKIYVDLCVNYLTENLLGDRISSEKARKFQEKQWEEDDPQLDTCKGSGYLSSREFNYRK